MHILLREAIQGALTHMANLIRRRRYVTTTLTLGKAFSLYLHGLSADCVYGFYSPSSQWAELRSLAALGNVIVRDSAGNVLAKIRLSLTAQYTIHRLQGWAGGVPNSEVGGGVGIAFNCLALANQVYNGDQISPAF